MQIEWRSRPSSDGTWVFLTAHPSEESHGHVEPEQRSLAQIWLKVVDWVLSFVQDSILLKILPGDVLFMFNPKRKIEKLIF